MVATNVNDMPRSSNADEFLKYCQLVKDGLINQGGNDIELLTNEAKVFCESVIKKTPFCQEKNGTCSSFLLLKDGKGPEFVSRLFQSSCYSPWLYHHLKTLHSNMVVEKKTPGTSGSQIRFVIPYLESPTWMTTPRLPISLGWWRHNITTCYYLKDTLLMEYEQLPIIDKHFGIAYLYVLSAIDSCFEQQFQGRSLSNLLEACNVKNIFLENYWKEENNQRKKKLLAKVIGFSTAAESGRNVFKEKIEEVMKRYEPYTSADLNQVLNSEYSHRAKLFFALQTRFDRLIDCIGSPPGWDFEAQYKPTSEIERLLNIVFIEEAEKLWGVLCFYNSVLKNSTKELLELFWVSGNRETRLKTWLQAEGRNGYSGNNQDILNALTKEKSENTAQNLLEKSRFNIPVAALFLAIPPPDSVYRCEVGFVSHLDRDAYSSVKQIWHFADINFPEIVDKTNDWEQRFTGLINKQKVLVGLITEPLLRNYLKDDVEKDIKERAKQNAELALMKKHGEMLNLLTKPLESLTDALNRTQEDTQRLRAILYNPTKGLFAAAPLVMDYFTEGHPLRLDPFFWEVSHEPDVYKNPFAACSVLAAVVCAIFGKAEAFGQARDGNALWCRTLELLNQSDSAFEQLTKTVKLFLWYHKGTNGNGEDKEKILREYIEKVLVDNIKVKPVEETQDGANFRCIKGSLNRFKKVIFTPFKEDKVHPLLPLALIFYEGSGQSPKITFTATTSMDMTYTYEKLGDILIRSETIKPFKGIGAGLPAPRYAMLLSFLSGIIDYAVRPPSNAKFTTAKIEVVDKQKCVIQMDFSNNELFKEMKSTFSAMARAVGTKGLRLNGNFLKPFVDFASLCSGEVQESTNQKFSILYPTENPKFASSIKAKNGSFSFTVEKKE